MSARAAADSTDAVTRLILQVFRLNGRLLSSGDRLVHDVGLTSARWQVLGAIALAGTPPTVPGIARAMGLTRQGVQRTVNELVADGLVAFSPNPAHQTAHLVVLTKAGRSVYEAAQSRQVPWARGLAEGLRRTDLSATERVLALLTERLEAAERSSLAPFSHGGRSSRRTDRPRRSHAEAR